MVRITVLLALLVTTCVHVKTHWVGLFFNLGAGYNSGELKDWIVSSQTGANFGLEFNHKSVFFRVAFNPETSGGLPGWWDDPIKTSFAKEIDGVLWPSEMQINFEAFQFLVGYESRIFDLMLIPYVGLAQSRLSVPFKYEPYGMEIVVLTPDYIKPSNRSDQLSI